MAQSRELPLDGGDKPKRRRRRGRRGRGQSKLQSPPQVESEPPATRPARSSTSADSAISSDPLYAALDLGTNNCRLLIARRSPDGFKVVDAYSRIVRLGEGLAHTGALGDAAMLRAIDALKICADKMARRGVVRARTIATAACRTASNGAAFIDRVKKETGLSLEVVSTEDEARLAVAGCAPLLDRTCSSALVFDIGGGSTELIWVQMEGTEESNGRKGKYTSGASIGDWVSLPCGVVTLAERHGGVEVPNAVYDRMVDEVAERLQPFLDRVKAASGWGSGSERGFHLLGTSGTVMTIAGVHLGLNRYDRTQVDGIWISPLDVQRVTRSLLDMDYDRRAAHPCVGQERADLVLAGCAIFEAIARAWPADRLRVADRGLREGILMSLMDADTARRRRRRRRRRKSAKPSLPSARQLSAK
nr:Ppx/GppA phosphatase family protein [Parvibaculum lavamentivorans]